MNIHEFKRIRLDIIISAPNIVNLAGQVAALANLMTYEPETYIDTITVRVIDVKLTGAKK